MNGPSNRMIPVFPRSGASRRLLCVLIAGVAIVEPQPMRASAADARAQGGNGRRGVMAVEAAAPIVVDGALDEQVWRDAEPAADFVQAEPHEGEPATEATEVRVATDQTASQLVFTSRPSFAICASDFAPAALVTKTKPFRRSANVSRISSKLSCSPVTKSLRMSLMMMPACCAVS